MEQKLEGVYLYQADGVGDRAYYSKEFEEKFVAEEQLNFEWDSREESCTFKSLGADTKIGPKELVEWQEDS